MNSPETLQEVANIIVIVIDAHTTSYTNIKFLYNKRDGGKNLLNWSAEIVCCLFVWCHNNGFSGTERGRRLWVRYISSVLEVILVNKLTYRLPSYIYTYYLPPYTPTYLPSILHIHLPTFLLTPTYLPPYTPTFLLTFLHIPLPTFLLIHLPTFLPSSIYTYLPSSL